MALYQWTSLEVIGYETGQFGEVDLPLIGRAIVAVRGTDIILRDNIRGESAEGINTEPEKISRKMLLSDVQSGVITLFDPPIQAEANHLLYCCQGTQQPEYINFTEAHQRMTKFCDELRAIGDAHFRSGDMQAAFQDYARCTAVSQEAVDYARLLLTDLGDKTRRERARQAIVQIFLQKAREEIEQSK